jgi:hypothetical protein
MIEAVDHDMRHVHALWAILARRALRHRTQARLGHGEGHERPDTVVSALERVANRLYGYN